MLNKVETNKHHRKKEEIQYEENYKNIGISSGIVMAFALQAPVNAAEKAAVPVMDREMEATTMMTDVTNQNFAPYYKSDKEITYRVAVPFGCYRSTGYLI